MTTTVPAATKHWHAQNAEQVCADPFNLEKAVDRSIVIQSNDNSKLLYISAITKWVNNLYSFKSPLAPLLHPEGARTSARQSGKLNITRLSKSYAFHFHMHSPLCKGGLGGICFAVVFLCVTSRPEYLSAESRFKNLLSLVRVGALALATGLGQAILTTTGGFIAIALAMTPQQEHAA